MGKWAPSVGGPLCHQSPMFFHDAGGRQGVKVGRLDFWIFGFADGYLPIDDEQTNNIISFTQMMYNTTYSKTPHL